MWPGWIPTLKAVRRVRLLLSDGMGVVALLMKESVLEGKGSRAQPLDLASLPLASGLVICRLLHHRDM